MSGYVTKDSLIYTSVPCAQEMRTLPTLNGSLGSATFTIWTEIEKKQNSLTVS